MQESANSQKLIAKSQKPTWIWYPGDFEIWLGNIFNNRRTERGAMFPPFWKQDSHYVTVEFSKAFNLDHEETITIAAEGQFNFAIDGKLQFPAKEYTIPAGKHKLNIKVWNQATPPALFIDGNTIHTDATWLATYEDKLWIDENGVAHGSGIYVPAASWHFNAIDTPPSSFHLERTELRPVSATVPEGEASGTLYDFGRETFGYLKVNGLKGTVRVYYGESREEALDRDHCETLDVLTSDIRHQTSDLASKAFRFVYIERTATPPTPMSSWTTNTRPSTHSIPALSAVPTTKSTASGMSPLTRWTLPPASSSWTASSATAGHGRATPYSRIS